MVVNYIWVLMYDGGDAKPILEIKQAVEKKSTVLQFVASTINGITANDRSELKANHQIDGGPSVLFDAVAIIFSSKRADKLAKEPTVILGEK